MTTQATRWAPLAGRWRVRGRAITYLGSESADSPAGLAVSDLSFREGRLRARITLPEVAAQGRLVIGLDRERTSQYTVGLGGRFAYYLDRLERQGPPAALQSWGSPENLSTGAHAISVTVAGQSLDLAVDDVPIFALTLPSRLIGDQVGAFAVGAGVRVEDVEAEAAPAKVFVVMKFDSPFNELYAEVIVPVCHRMGLVPYRADDFQYPGVILHDIVSALVEATVVIAEITPESPNVFYELGYAHAIGKPAILLAQKGRDLPFDVSGFRVIFYDDTIAGKPTVERELQAHLQNILGLPAIIE